MMDFYKMSWNMSVFVVTKKKKKYDKNWNNKYVWEKRECKNIKSAQYCRLNTFCWQSHAIVV